MKCAGSRRGVAEAAYELPAVPEALAKLARAAKLWLLPELPAVPKAPAKLANLAMIMVIMRPLFRYMCSRQEWNKD